MHHPIRLILILALAVPPFFAADISGKWLFNFNTEGGQREMSVNLTLNDDVVTADFGGQKLGGTFRDDKLQLSGNYTSAEAGREGQFELKAILKGQEFKGDGRWNEHSFTFVAKRIE